MRRFLAVFVAPVLAVLAWQVLPLARGAATLYLRDVLNTHLEMKAAEARSLSDGALPLVDPYRAGGQPLLGNPNAGALYPDTLLYRVAPVLWALNAHFWIHLLLAPFAMHWMARAWGLGREAAWAAGVSYALCGYVLSQSLFYNLIPGAVLTPALVAAALRLAEDPARRGPILALAAIWSLMILSGGDPLLSLLALALAIAAVLVRHGRGPAWRSTPVLAGALACGTLLAAPQIVEFLRISGASFRGYHGYSAETWGIASWDPRQAVEWLVPFVFGRPDRLGAGAFWGQRFFTGNPPYYYSLYPGLLALALAAASFAKDRPRGRAFAWGAAAAAVGLLLALGRFNPLATAILRLGGGAVRFPVKFWLPVAVGSSLLAGIGFERVFMTREPRARRIFFAALAALALAFATGWLTLTLAPGPIDLRLRGVIPPSRSDAFVAGERQRWAGSCAASCALVVILAAVAGCAAFRRRPTPLSAEPADAAALPEAPWAGALLLAIHAVAQTTFLAPLLATDAAAAYATPPPLLERIPQEALVVHGAWENLFGPSAGGRAYPGPEAFWFERRAFQELYPMTGSLYGRRYELNVSSEGMDTFLSTAARDAVRLAADSDRVRLLAAWGVGYLLLDRPLDPTAQDRVEPLEKVLGFGGDLFIYRLLRPARPIAVVGSVRRAPDLNAAVRLLEDPAFDPGTTVVLPGGAAPVDGPPGEIRIIAGDPGGPGPLRVQARAPGPGVLVLQRAWLPIYRAEVDGRRVPIKVANLHRIAVELPAGSHEVLIEADGRPFRRSLGGVILGAAGLAFLARRREGPR